MTYLDIIEIFNRMDRNILDVKLATYTDTFKKKIAK